MLGSALKKENEPLSEATEGWSTGSTGMKLWNMLTTVASGEVVILAADDGVFFVFEQAVLLTDEAAVLAAVAVSVEVSDVT